MDNFLNVLNRYESQSLALIREEDLKQLNQSFKRDLKQSYDGNSCQRYAQFLNHRVSHLQHTHVYCKAWYQLGKIQERNNNFQEAKNNYICFNNFKIESLKARIPLVPDSQIAAIIPSIGNLGLNPSSIAAAPACVSRTTTTTTATNTDTRARINLFSSSVNDNSLQNLPTPFTTTSNSSLPPLSLSSASTLPRLAYQVPTDAKAMLEAGNVGKLKEYASGAAGQKSYDWAATFASAIPAKGDEPWMTYRDLAQIAASKGDYQEAFALACIAGNRKKFGKAAHKLILENMKVKNRPLYDNIHNHETNLFNFIRSLIKNPPADPSQLDSTYLPQEGLHLFTDTIKRTPIVRFVAVRANGSKRPIDDEENQFYL